jgi:hypothetical protein
VPAPIVVEVYSPQPGPQELAVLIAACTRAAAPNECISSEARTADSPLGVAIVRRDGDRARIELGLRSVVSAEWSTSDLVFQAGDDELERYRAIGFAIGTLVARRLEPVMPATPPTEQPAAAAVVSPPPVSPKPPVERRPAPPAAPRQRSTWLDLAGGVGLGLVPGAPRAGGALRAASELLPGGLFGVTESSYSERSGDSSLRVRWFTVALGLGHPLGLRIHKLGVDARLLFVVERISLTAQSGERSDAAVRWKPGLSAALDVHWQLLPPLGLVVSAETHVDRRSEIRSGGEHVGETPALGLSGFVGLRLKLR